LVIIELRNNLYGLQTNDVRCVEYVEKKKIACTTLVGKQSLELLGGWTRKINSTSYRKEVYLDWIQTWTEKKYSAFVKLIINFPVSLRHTIFSRKF
jgi:hypothetical protein